jgi:hypothetical protein
MKETGKNAVAFILSTLRISKEALLMSVFNFSPSSDLMTIAKMLFLCNGTETIAPTGTSEEVKYRSSSAILERDSGMTVMMFMGYL